MKKTLLKFTPVALLALAACNNSETPVEGKEAEAEAAVEEPVELPPSIVANDVYRCADGTILYVDFLGTEGADGPKSGANIRIGEKTATAINVQTPKPEPLPEGEAEDGASDPAEAQAAGPMASADGEATLEGEGTSIKVKLPGKGAQSCKG